MERPHFDIVASGARMRQIRRQRNISVKQVMEYMGFESMQAVYKWEAGKCFPQADNLIALAMLYQVNPIELLVKEEDEMSSSCFIGKYIFQRRGLFSAKTCTFFDAGSPTLFLDVRNSPDGSNSRTSSEVGHPCITKNRAMFLWGTALFLKIAFFA